MQFKIRKQHISPATVLSTFALFGVVLGYFVNRPRPLKYVRLDAVDQAIYVPQYIKFIQSAAPYRQALSKKEAALQTRLQQYQSAFWFQKNPKELNAISEAYTQLRRDAMTLENQLRDTQRFYYEARNRGLAEVQKRVKSTLVTNAFGREKDDVTGLVIDEMKKTYNTKPSSMEEDSATTGSIAAA